MHTRTKPVFPDLQSFLRHLEAEGRLARIAPPVDVRLEAAEVHRRIIAEAGPALRFEQPVRGGASSSFPLVTNLFGTKDRVAAGLGTEVAGLSGLGELLAWMRSPRPPGSLAEARRLLPAARAGLRSRHRVVRDTVPVVDAALDLSVLPIQTCWPGDAGPLITWPSS